MRKLTVLGSGDAFATGGKYTTSFLVDQNGCSFLIDCGASTLVRLKQLSIPLTSIHHIFITHFHGDHFGGVPFIILSNKIELGGNHAMTIYGPAGIKMKVRQLQEALYPGTGVFIDGLPLTFVEYDLEWQSVFQGFEVKAIPVTHAAPSLPHALKFNLGDKLLSFTGDTEWDERLIELAAGSELLITECNNYQKDSPGHLSLKTIVEKRDLLDCNRIMLSHMGAEMLELQKAPFERLEDGMEINLW